MRSNHNTILHRKNETGEKETKATEMTIFEADLIKAKECLLLIELSFLIQVFLALFGVSQSD